MAFDIVTAKMIGLAMADLVIDQPAICHGGIRAIGQSFPEPATHQFGKYLITALRGDIFRDKNLTGGDLSAILLTGNGKG